MANRIRRVARRFRRTHVCISICVCVCVCISLSLSPYIYIYIYTCIHIYIYICVYIYIYIHYLHVSYHFTLFIPFLSNVLYRTATSVCDLRYFLSDFIYIHFCLFATMCSFLSNVLYRRRPGPSPRMCSKTLMPLVGRPRCGRPSAQIGGATPISSHIRLLVLH